VESPEAVSRTLLAARRKGEALHYILSLVGHLPDEPSSVIEKAVAAGVRRFRLLEYEEELRERVERFLVNPRVRPLFGLEEADRVFTEREVVDGTGQTFKVDRIVVREESVDVVEFKSGEPREGTHGEQVRRYGELLGEIFPGQPVRTHLLYLDEGEVVPR
jgi:ATP-dependent helicase/nuclease subunit A